MEVLLTVVFVYFFSLVSVLAAWHGVRFFRSLFRSGRGGDQP